MPPDSHLSQSVSAVQLVGHLFSHAPVLPQVWFPVQDAVLPVTQATHLLCAVSQTWCIGSQAAQSASFEQEMVGVPAFVGQVSSFGAQVPKDVHTSPGLHGVLASQAMQRVWATSQIVRP
ncbi:MAG: hypothetical protein DYH12_04435 [Sorangiineae bacterium PRO1]|nr:hypothetical protein [Sorangiineae bacterium PRO1]